MLRISILPLLLLITLGLSNPDPTSEIDAYWDAVSRTVNEGDFEGYSALYHPDAILVNKISDDVYPIANALAGWKSGFDNTKAGKMKASVEFRFSERIHSGDTAHDTGIFLYTAQAEGGEPQPFLCHFQGLLIKKDGKWLMMMEYQISQASQAEWDALAN